MPGMKHPRWPNLERRVSRHGRVCWYVRKGHGLRTRLRAPMGTPEFEAEYLGALRGATPSKQKGSTTGTLRWLWEQYCDSSAWASLSKATQGQRENIMKHVLKGAGEAPLREITRKLIVDGRERRKGTPSQANNFLKLMRGLFAWAIEAEYLKSNPAEAVKAIKTKTAGFRAWEEDDVEKFERRWPLGTRERLALTVLLYTRLRRGDAARIGRQHIKNGRISVATEKTGTQVTIPLAPELVEAIRAVKPKGLTFVAQGNGQPLTKESFGNWFGETCKAAGLMGYNAHGLRKLAATRLAINGATVHELNAVFGWTGSKMALHYVALADRARLAAGGAAKNKKPEAVVEAIEDFFD
jgi:integrase